MAPFVVAYASSVRLGASELIEAVLMLELPGQDTAPEWMPMRPEFCVLTMAIDTTAANSPDTRARAYPPPHRLARSPPMLIRKGLDARSHPRADPHASWHAPPSSPPPRSR